MGIWEISNNPLVSLKSKILKYKKKKKNVKELNNIYPMTLINITNRCNLNSMLCFVFRDGNPNMPTKKNEIPAEEMIVKIKKFKKNIPFCCHENDVDCDLCGSLWSFFYGSCNTIKSEN
jgi:uncharacterized radical SAM superfamily Fe-S cluster-containing enzyme